MFKNLLIILFFAGFISVFGQNEIRINELLSSNINGFVDIESGEFSDWIELYNPSDSLLDLSGYLLTDNIQDSLFWVFPNNTLIDSNSYLIIWMDDIDNALHANFKLNNDGEEIYLLDNKARLIDSVTFGKQQDDVSYGREINYLNQWAHFAEPTPGYKNTSIPYKNNELSKEPKFTLESGFYSAGIQVEFDIPNNGKVYYTVDGTIPNVSRGKIYTNIIEINTTTVIRAICVQDSLLPSDVISSTFFINENSGLPVVSITTDPKNLWDDEIGINTIGTNGISLWGVNANYWQDWERPIKIEYFDKEKSLAFELNAGIAINGARRNMLQRSFRIFARKKYGTSEINYKLFDEKEIRRFTSLVLRNGGYPEFRFTMFRDGFMQNLLPNEMDLDYQGYEPSVLFINGQYWGIYNIREKQNEDYLKDNRGVNPDSLDILEKNMTVIEGDNLHYKNMISFIETHDLSTDENYDSVLQWMDVDNYMNYQIAELYFANIDWPGNNVKYWRPRTPDGKWKWILFDVDGGFGVDATSDFNSMEYVTDANSEKWNNAPWSTFLFRNLIINKGFEDEFVQRFAAYMNYSFNSETVIEEINKFQNKIEEEFPRHIKRWATGCSTSNPESKDGCLFQNISTWYSNVDVMRNFALRRPGFLINNLKEYFLLDNPYYVTLTTIDHNSGNVFVNGVKAIYGINASLFGEKPVIIEAKPKTGYRFVGWEGSIESNDSTLELFLNKNISLNAVFESININNIPNVIKNEYQLKVENSPYSTENDIYIYENANLKIDAGVEINMPEGTSIYVFGSISVNGSIDDPVIIKSKIDSENWGSINFINATDKSLLSHINISGSTNGKDELSQFGGISSFNSDVELNFLYMDSVKFPIYVEYGNFIMRNSKIHTDVTSDYVNVKYGSAIIENCEFIGNYAIDTDAIDYDDVTSGVIRRNIIHDFLGNNSDAIDIGEGAQSILVEENLIYNCSDKGISIGQESTVNIRGNIIAFCNLGVGIKDDNSYGFVDHNTFYNNDIAISCFEKILGRGGGKADVTNTVFSNSLTSDVFVDEFSNINIKYSLSDKLLLEGEGNLFGSPEFINTDSMDFRVSQSSLTINSGDPDYNFDADGTRTNIGAIFNDFNNQNNIIITEINYHSNSEFNSKDWLELFNPNDNAVDLSYWIFKDNEDEHSFTFQNQQIDSHEFLILSEDSSEFKKIFPDINNIVGNFNFGLNNSGETIRLFDSFGNIVDSLTYNDKLPWSPKADGEGYTLQLINFESDNALAENWNSSVLFGTPGNDNVIVNQDEPEKIPELYFLSQNYPNPFNPVTRINYQLPQSSRVTLKIFDILGREVVLLVNDTQKAGSYSVDFKGNHLSSGIYFYQLSTSDFQSTKKMILLK